MLESTTCYVNPYQIVKITKPYKMEMGQYAGYYYFDIILSNGDKERNVYPTLKECNSNIEKVLSIINEVIKCKKL